MENMPMLHLANLKIGHATDEEHNTGCTVFLCPPETTGGADIRGMAPGSREIGLLDPIKSVPHIHAVLLTGGSAFGLAAADGAMRYLSERGIGHPTPVMPVPLVPTAVVYDLFINGGARQPDSALGYAACEAAAAGEIPAQGCYGAGAGVTVGKWAGWGHFMKSGFGMASHQIGDAEVFAAAVVNAVGDVVNEDGTVLAGARNHEQGSWMVETDPLRRFPSQPPASLTNTTLVVVATTALLDKIAASRLAQRAHDGLAIAIRPVHTMHDGDTTFALSTGKVTSIPFDTIANAAVDAVAVAIRSAVRHARTVGQLPGLADLDLLPSAGSDE